MGVLREIFAKPIYRTLPDGTVIHADTLLPRADAGQEGNDADLQKPGQTPAPPPGLPGSPPAGARPA